MQNVKIYKHFNNQKNIQQKNLNWEEILNNDNIEFNTDIQKASLSLSAGGCVKHLLEGSL